MASKSRHPILMACVNGQPREMYNVENEIGGKPTWHYLHHSSKEISSCTSWIFPFGLWRKPQLLCQCTATVLISTSEVTVDKPLLNLKESHTPAKLLEIRVICWFYTSCSSRSNWTAISTNHKFLDVVFSTIVLKPEYTDKQFIAFINFGHTQILKKTSPAHFLNKTKNSIASNFVCSEVETDCSFLSSVKALKSFTSQVYG